MQFEHEWFIDSVFRDQFICGNEEKNGNVNLLRTALHKKSYSHFA
jgi:hypothetical protein